MVIKGEERLKGLRDSYKEEEKEEKKALRKKRKSNNFSDVKKAMGRGRRVVGDKPSHDYYPRPQVFDWMKMDHKEGIKGTKLQNKAFKRGMLKQVAKEYGVKGVEEYLSTLKNKKAFSKKGDQIAVFDELLNSYMDNFRKGTYKKDFKGIKNYLPDIKRTITNRNFKRYSDLYNFVDEKALPEIKDKYLKKIEKIVSDSGLKELARSEIIKDAKRKKSKLTRYNRVNNDSIYSAMENGSFDGAFHRAKALVEEGKKNMKPVHKKLLKALEGDYSPLNEEKYKKFVEQYPSKEVGKLEKALWSVGIGTSFLYSLLFFSPNITGNAVSNLSNGSSSVVGACFFVIGLAVSFLYSKR